MAQSIAPLRKVRNGGFMLSGYRLMWLVVMFDLPVIERAERKAASAFRNDLLDMGFEMSQFSVYVRFCSGPAQVDKYCGEIATILPNGGKVTILQFTDKQYERTISYQGTRKQVPKKAPDQYDLF
jgi:CRISPR-associated protein Cas2